MSDDDQEIWIQRFGTDFVHVLISASNLSFPEHIPATFTSPTSQQF